MQEADAPLDMQGGELIDFEPKLSREYSVLLLTVCSEVAFASLEHQVRRLVSEAAHYAIREGSSTTTADPSALAYRASLLLLRDLLTIGWRLELVGPRMKLRRAILPVDASSAKGAIRRSMMTERTESLNVPSVRAFIGDMETDRTEKNGMRSVLELVGEAQQLVDLSAHIEGLGDEEALASIKTRIRPYLQLIEGEERDKYTNLRLIDIWRYFRLTWSTPYRSTPGRNIFYLVRDAAQKNHPVIGIAALGNVVVGLRCRDDAIGWTADALARRLEEANLRGDDEFRRVCHELGEHLNYLLERGLKVISLEGIATKNTLNHPSEDSIERLIKVAGEADNARVTLLRSEQDQGKEDLPDFQLVSNDGNAEPQTSSEALFRRKRATKLAKLLKAKLVVKREHLTTNPASALPALLWSDKMMKVPNEEGRSAVRTILNVAKDEHVGNSMMEIIVCGAIPPYNHVLGGKLVAMLLTSPQVVEDYRRRYSGQVSVIASKVAGVEVRKAAQLVYLGTSSLYAFGTERKRKNTVRGSSQYNKLSVPGSVFGRVDEVRYEYVGQTDGFGVVHFSQDTREALEQLDAVYYGAKRINSVFGEGTSPRMRKIRQGMGLLNLDDRFLVHGQSRLVFAVRLARNTNQYLLGASPEPEYVFPKNAVTKASKLIAEYWMQRWLVGRLRRQETVQALRSFSEDSITVSKDFPD